jgi:hypothetical protein
MQGKHKRIIAALVNPLPHRAGKHNSVTRRKSAGFFAPETPSQDMTTN